MNNQPGNTLEIRPVSGKKELGAFIRVPWRIYKEDPSWVAPLIVERKQAFSAKNPFFKSAYLDLSELLQHVTPILNEKGLVLLQPLKDGLVGTQIIDAESGDILAESFLPLPNTLNDPLKIGGCVTYFRRYTLKSLLSIAEVDDDGNLASKPTPKKKIELKLETKEFSSALEYLKKGGNITDIEKKYTISDANREELMNNAI